jgi:predicted ribosome quality control (RQC) complex YloA/Tae2 family protein
MKRGLSSFDVYTIVAELQDFKGGYVDKIYHIPKEIIVIKINNKNSGKKENIFVKNGELFCTTQKKFTTPIKPSTFAMTLRKYLLNGRISNITQHEFDRIIKIDIKKKEGDYSLIFELFKNGNIILLSPQGKIILPLFIQRWAHRTLQPHKVYKPPPSQINPFNLDQNKFIELLEESKKDIVRTLAVKLNLGGTYAEEICYRSGIDKNIELTNLSQESIITIYKELQKFLRIFSRKKFQPMYVQKKGKTIDILPIPFQSYVEVKFVKTDSFNKGIQEFIEIEQIEEKEKSIYNEKLQKLQRQYLKQKKIIDEYQEKVVQKKSEGDIIYLNFQTCKELLDDIQSLLEQKDKKEEIEQINKKNFVKNFDPTLNELIVILKDNQDKTHEIKLDFRKTVTENADKAYRESKKLKEKINGAKESMNETQKKIKTLEKKVILEKEEKEIKKGRTYWFEKFRWFLSIEGNIILAGKDAKSNEQLVKKYLKEGDRYVHADIHGAPSCVVKSMDINDKKIPISDKTLEEACKFAASYSKAWKQFSEVQVYWVLPEQVSKTPQSGEFLPKGSFVIRGKRNYLNCVLEVAIGVIEINGFKRIMGGPLESIKSRTDKYVVLKPGVMKKSTTSKKLSNIFHISIPDIERVLPPGETVITKTAGLEIK